ncbi:MAG: hypothetical protein IH624_18460 [Phycisphaerae bacterium]|nr:hypothetical protein [Phycisphaerae bacterium]
MCRTVNPSIRWGSVRRRRAPRRCPRAGGFTLTEVVVASALLITAIVPILKALTTVHFHAALIERKTRCLNIAHARLEEIKARSVYNYATNFAEANTSADGPYLRTVSDTAISPNLRRISVTAGFDADGNGALNAGETLVTLQTLVAKRW